MITNDISFASQVRSCDKYQRNNFGYAAVRDLYLKKNVSENVQDV